ncbi:MAG: hypothetical protein ACLPXT_08455 [Terracidiphilus sp.]
MKRSLVCFIAMVLLMASGVPAQTPAPAAQPPVKPSAQAPAPASTQPPAQTTTQPVAPASAQNPAKSPVKADPWAALRFLLGTWEAKTIGGVAQAQASAGYAFRLELRDHILARHSRSGACSAPDDFDCQHSDLLYIYPAATGQAFEAIYFDNEGHVIHYGITTPKPGTAVFLSDPAQTGPQYRLSYTFLNEVMSGQFEMKMPGQADFISYLEWSGKRQ